VKYDGQRLYPAHDLCLSEISPRRADPRELSALAMPTDQTAVDVGHRKAVR
jgi:hypothetical protein